MWFQRLQSVYDDFEQFSAYAEICGSARRLGFLSAAAAWKANPMVQGSAEPRDYRKLTPRTITLAARHGMARAFFADAWASQCEAYGHGAELSGREIFDIMPAKIDPAATEAAYNLHHTLETRNGATLADIWERWNMSADTQLSPDKWGHYAAMQAMGHGVGLWEYGPDHLVSVPDLGFSWINLSRDYFKPAKGYPAD